VVAVMALIVSGCGFVIVNNANPGTASDPIRIVSPAHRTQLTSVASVPVSVQLPGIDPASFAATLTTGSQWGVDTDVTARFTVSGSSATATLGPADFLPGLTRLAVSGVPTGGGARVVRDAV